MAGEKINYAVGIRWGTSQVRNTAKDQVTVAELLRKVSIANGGRREQWELTPLISEGRCNPDLAKAIKDFQTFWKNKGEFRVVDGVIDPGGTTFHKLYSLANQLPPAPTPSDDPVIPPSGLPPTPQDFASVTFTPPLVIGFGIKISLADPFILGTIGGALSLAGITIPHGCDIILGTVHTVGGFEISKLRPMSGVLLGVTPRRGAGKWTIDQTIDVARRNGASQQVIKVLELLRDSPGQFASSAAIGAGIGFIMAKGFNNIGEIHGYRASARDEMSFNLAIGGKLSAFFKAITKLAELANIGLQGWSIIDMARKLDQDKSKAVATFDIPGLSLGVDVGLSTGTCTWYALDVLGLATRMVDLLRTKPNLILN